MFCSNCGAPIKEGAKFCTSCGAPVTQGNEGEEVLEAHVVEDEIPQDPVDAEPSYAWPTVESEPAQEPMDRSDAFGQAPAPGTPPAPVRVPAGAESSVLKARSLRDDLGGQVDWGQRVSEAFSALFKAPAYPATDKPLKFYKFLVWVALYLSAIGSASNIVTDIFSSYGSFFDVPIDLMLLLVALYSRGRLAEFRADGPSTIALLCIASLIKSALSIIPMLIAGFGVAVLIGFVLGIGLTALLWYLVKLYFDRRAELFVN